MDYFDVVKARRSIRKFTSKQVPEDVVQRALEAAVLAPNSSNTQTWDFYRVQSPEKKEKLVEYCLKQSAARTADQLIVVVADPKLWKRSHQPLIRWVEAAKAPSLVHTYYKKLIPITYTWGPLNLIGFSKWIVASLTGLFRPTLRGPHTKAQLQEVAIKSAALAAENFVLAISAQGFASCMMEGFDECRVKRLLRLSCSARVVMVLAVGESHERGTWGPQMRISLDEVVHKV